ncbi:hypothetical protein P43SY_002965 [Pythium insidiosum]|uniref:Uncharacterized protein n=1 Tax=Pythium insidiosum TaxID=114742 RepID=A0AAD5Q3P4_PYTIN|nr:hypothetical protein P43SY_002965 [Pythium insidiosum]
MMSRSAKAEVAPMAVMAAVPVSRRHDGGVRSKFAVPDAGTPLRRRRLRPKLSAANFESLTTQFLDRVDAAVAPLLPPTNDVFAVDRSTPGTVILRTATKEFELKVVSSKQQLHLQSPISGLRKYEWNAKTQRWEDETDAHDIEGLLTRDLMRLCSGIPAF